MHTQRWRRRMYTKYAPAFPSTHLARQLHGTSTSLENRKTELLRMRKRLCIVCACASSFPRMRTNSRINFSIRNVKIVRTAWIRTLDLWDSLENHEIDALTHSATTARFLCAKLLRLKKLLKSSAQCVKWLCVQLLAFMKSTPSHQFLMQQIVGQFI